MQMMDNAKRYDWQTWLMGIMRAFLSGAGGAVGGGSAPMMIDPDHFNLAGGLHHTLLCFALSFLGAGIVSLGVFLHTHGCPDPVTVMPSAPQ